MANVFDIADYILSRKGPMSAMKLQKLVYYSQAWHAVWDEVELFPQAIEAWVGGPVVRELYDRHRGRFRLEQGFFKGDLTALNESERDSVDRVLEFYGDKNNQWLTDLSRMESPWKDTRVEACLGIDEQGTVVISMSKIAEYYSSLR